MLLAVTTISTQGGTDGRVLPREVADAREDGTTPAGQRLDGQPPKAGEQMRVAGIDGVGIAELMAQAGLTHGGFYAHFRNKAALVAEVCRDGIGQTLERYRRATGALPTRSPPAPS